MKRDKNYLLLGVLLLLFLQLPVAQSVWAQTDGPDGWTIQATAARTLLNGLRIEILAAPHFPKVAIHLLVGVGTTLDPARKEGLAELTAAMLIDSVPEWQGDPEEIDTVINAGKTFRYEVDWDSTHFYAECLPHELETYLNAASRLVERPVLTRDRFAAVKERLLEKLGQEPTSVGLGRTIFNAEMFRGNPYARPMLGTIPSVQDIVYGETVLFQRRYYLPNVSFLGLIGTVAAEEVKVQAGRALGIWVMEAKFPFTFLPPKGQTGLTFLALDLTKAAESTLTMGHIGLTRASKDYMSLSLISSILNGEAQSRLFPSLGSSSDLRFEMEGRRLKGPLRIVLRKNDMKVTDVVREIRQGLADFLENGPTAEEMSRAVGQLLTALRDRVQKAPELARMLVEAGTYQLGFNYYERLKQELPDLTAEDLRETANSLINLDNMLAVYVGPVTGQNLNALKDDGWVLRIIPAQ